MSNSHILSTKALACSESDEKSFPADAALLSTVLNDSQDLVTSPVPFMHRYHTEPLSQPWQRERDLVVQDRPGHREHGCDLDDETSLHFRLL